MLQTNPRINEYLTIRNYKEPLKEIPKGKGFGYYGCLIVSTDGEVAQCHLCGGLFRAVSSHIISFHKMKVRDYREQFQLSPMTALVSEKEREDRKQRMLEMLSSLSPEQKRQWREAAKRGRAKRSNYQPKITLETKNKRGTCPDQLLEKIKEVATKIGHTPSLAEFIDQTGGQRYKHLIFTTFGSWKNAVHMANLIPKERVLKGYRRYSDAELLEYLSLFAQEHRRLPTATDCKRGLLPDYNSFRRFGSFEKARQLAGVYNFI